jgi:hypothetical protein
MEGHDCRSLVLVTTGFHLGLSMFLSYQMVDAQILELPMPAWSVIYLFDVI